MVSLLLSLFPLFLEKKKKKMGGVRSRYQVLQLTQIAFCKTLPSKEMFVCNWQ